MVAATTRSWNDDESMRRTRPSCVHTLWRVRVPEADLAGRRASHSLRALLRRTATVSYDSSFCVWNQDEHQLPLGTHTHMTRCGTAWITKRRSSGAALPPPVPSPFCPHTLLFLVCVLVALRAVVGTCRRWPSSLLLLLSSPFLFTRAPGTGLSTLQPPAWPRGAPPPPQHPRRPRRRPAPRSRRWPCRPARRRADPPRRR